MTTFKKIIGVFIGTIILGLGVAFFEISSLGFDGLSCLVVAIQKLINTSYSLAYLLVNLLFLIIMLIFLRKQIGLGSVLNYLLTGVFCDIFMYLFKIIHLTHSELLIINILFGLLGVLFLSLGVAIYANADLGVTPYDSIPLIIVKHFKLFNKTIKYHIARKIVDGTCIVLGVLIGTLYLKQHYIFGINTVLTFIFVGYIVSYSSKLINKYIYKKSNDTFN